MGRVGQRRRRSGLDLPDFEAARHHTLAGLADLVQEEVGK
ncbi:DUF6894 family protein [Bosea sp. Root483D1]